MQCKTAAIRAFIYRAYKLSSSLINFEKRHKIIEAIFINNGYQFKFIQKIKQRVTYLITQTRCDKGELQGCAENNAHKNRRSSDLQGSTQLTGVSMPIGLDLN